MKGVKSEFRSQMVARMPGKSPKFTENRQREAFSRKWLQGWMTAMPPVGPAYEKVALIQEDHRLAPVVRFARAGKREFDLFELEEALECHPFSEDGQSLLGKVGLAITGFDQQDVILTPADPRAARLVNPSRFGVSKRGYLHRIVIEAMLANRNPSRRWIQVRDEGRVRTVEVLNNRWEIECDDLLDVRRYVKLVSRWILVPPPKSSGKWRVMSQPSAA